MLDAMVNTLNLSRYLANQVMHYRSRSLDNVSIKIAHFPVSSDLKPSEEAPIMDMLIKAINKLKLRNGMAVAVVGIRGDGEHRNDEALSTSSEGMPTTMQALATRAAATSDLVFDELLRNIGSTYSGRGRVSIDDTAKLKKEIARRFFEQKNVTNLGPALVSEWLGVRSLLASGAGRDLPVRECDMLLLRDQLLARIGEGGGRAGMPTSELKAELKTRGLSDSGTKTALQSRLREAVADPGTAAAPTPPPPPQPDQYWLDPSPASIATRASFGVDGEDASDDDELMFDVAGDDDDEGAEAFRHAHPRENALAAANRANNAEWAWRYVDGSLHELEPNFMGMAAFLELDLRREAGRYELAKAVLARHERNRSLPELIAASLGGKDEDQTLPNFVDRIYDDRAGTSVALSHAARSSTSAIMAMYKHAAAGSAIERCTAEPTDLGTWSRHLINNNNAWSTASVAGIVKAYRVHVCSTNVDIGMDEFRALLVDMELRRLMQDSFAEEGVDFRTWLYCPDVSSG